jgi:hypothetical protein
METSMAERLDNLIECLSAQIAFLRSSGWEESAQLLEMARLEIQLRRHSISDQELRELCALHGTEELAAGQKPDDRSMIREPINGSATVRSSAARVVVPMETHPNRTRSRRKHAR